VRTFAVSAVTEISNDFASDVNHIGLQRSQVSASATRLQFVSCHDRPNTTWVPYTHSHCTTMYLEL